MRTCVPALQSTRMKNIGRRGGGALFSTHLAKDVILDALENSFRPFVVCIADGTKQELHQRHCRWTTHKGKREALSWVPTPGVDLSQTMYVLDRLPRWDSGRDRRTRRRGPQKETWLDHENGDNMHVEHGLSLATEKTKIVLVTRWRKPRWEEERTPSRMAMQWSAFTASWPPGSRTRYLPDWWPTWDDRRSINGDYRYSSFIP